MARPGRFRAAGGALHVFFASVVALSGAPSVHADGKLQRASRALREGESRHSGPASRTRRKRHHHHDDCDEDRGVVWALLSAIFDGDDEDDDPEPRRAGYTRTPFERPAAGFAPYPYRYSVSPYVLPLQVQLAAADAGAASDVPLQLPHARPWAAQLWVDGGAAGPGEGDGLLWQGRANGRVMMPTHVELELGALWMVEPRPRAGTDQVALWHAHASYRVLEVDRAIVRVGGGLRTFVDAEGPVAGPEIAAGMDWFVVRPFVLSAQASVAALGETALLDARLQLGALIQRFELYAGYELLRIDEVDLSAPVLGLRVWL